MKDIEGIEEVLQILKPHWKDIQADFDRHNERFLELASTDHDAIGRVLRSHLVVEHFLNSYLAAHYDIDEFDELRLSFFQKAKLLPSRNTSAAYVRPGILQLNSVRNKFGHQTNHRIDGHEISAILQVLGVARSGTKFENSVEAIEAFAPVACAFLSLPDPPLRKLFAEAFANVRSYTPESVVSG